MILKNIIKYTIGLPIIILITIWCLIRILVWIVVDDIVELRWATEELTDIWSPSR